MSKAHWEDEVSEEPTLLASVIGAVSMYAASLGVPLPEVMAVTGMGPEDFADPDARIPYTKGLALWDLLSERFPERALGLELAQSMPLSAYGAVGFASRNVQTVRDVIRVWVRYSAVVSSHISLQLVDERSEPSLLIQHVPELEAQRHVMELSMAVSIRWVGQFTESDGAALVSGVYFKHGAYAPAEVYREHFGAPVFFEQPSIRVVFRPGVLDMPVVGSEPALYRFIQTHLEAVQAGLNRPERSEQDPLSDVRDAIARLAERSDYTAEGLATLLGVGLRSLQRRVRAHNTSVRALLEAHREAHACRLLEESRLTLDDVAFLTGYSDERAFNRAFKRWTGQTPAQYRRRSG